MIRLALDTSFHFLTLALFEDDTLLASIQKPAYKQQSETILSELDSLFRSVGLKPESIQELIVTHGPGSYTGLRIAMTIVKILGSISKIHVYTLSSLLVLAGLEPQVSILIDARAERVYYARYDQGKALIEDCVIPLSEAKALIQKDDNLYGHLSLLGMEDRWPDYALNFILLKEFWIKVESIHTLAPRYLKEHSAYHS